MKSRMMVLVLMISVVAGCGKALLPSAEQTGLVDVASRSVTKPVGGASVTIQTHQWQFNPPELDQFYTPFLVLIKNDSDRKIDVAPRSFLLIDAGGNQLKPVFPAEAEKEMINRGVVLTPASRLRPGEGGMPYPAGPGPGLPPVPPRPLGSDIVTLSLPEGEILPGSVVRGFVYFPRRDPAGDALKIHLEIDQAAEEFFFVLMR